MEETVIYKYLSGATTGEEEAELLNWLHESPENQAYFYELKAIWHARQQTVFANESNLNDSLERMNNRIRLSVEQNKKKRNLFIRWSSVAAVFLLLIGISVLFLINKNVQDVEVPLCVYANGANADSVRVVTLVDGTEVWLAANTTLSCPEVFSGDERKVYLDGTAFFDVTKDPQHPFVVRTDIMEIKVLGTSFSVNSHTSGNQGETILMTGSVQLKHLGNKQVVTLFPGQQALYSKETSGIEIHEVDANTLTSWRFGIISLIEVTASEIIQKLEEIYHVKIKMDTSSIKDHKYNFSFKRANSLEKVLEQFSCVTGTTLEIVD